MSVIASVAKQSPLNYLDTILPWNQPENTEIAVTSLSRNDNPLEFGVKVLIITIFI